MKINQKGFSAIEGLLLAIIVGAVGFVGWYVWHARNINNVAKTVNSNGSVYYENKEFGFAFTIPKALTTKKNNVQINTSIWGGVGSKGYGYDIGWGFKSQSYLHGGFVTNDYEPPKSKHLDAGSATAAEWKRKNPCEVNTDKRAVKFVDEAELCVIIAPNPESDSMGGRKVDMTIYKKFSGRARTPALFFYHRAKADDYSKESIDGIYISRGLKDPLVEFAKSIKEL